MKIFLLIKIVETISFDEMISKLYYLVFYWFNSDESNICGHSYMRRGNRRRVHGTCRTCIPHFSWEHRIKIIRKRERERVKRLSQIGLEENY